MADYIEDSEVEAQDEPQVQQYEGDDVDALVLAKQRMAERDAEYAKAHPKAPEGRLNKPASKPAAKPAAKSENFDYAEDAPLSESVDESAVEDKPAKRNPEMTAPIVKEAADKVRSAFSRAFNSKTTDVSYKEANRGLRSLKGESELPKSDAQKEREEFVKAFKK